MFAYSNLFRMLDSHKCAPGGAGRWQRGAPCPVTRLCRTLDVKDMGDELLEDTQWSSPPPPPPPPRPRTAWSSAGQYAECAAF